MALSPLARACSVIATLLAIVGILGLAYTAYQYQRLRDQNPRFQQRDVDQTANSDPAFWLSEEEFTSETDKLMQRSIWCFIPLAASIPFFLVPVQERYAQPRQPLRLYKRSDNC